MPCLEISNSQYSDGREIRRDLRAYKQNRIYLGEHRRRKWLASHSGDALDRYQFLSTARASARQFRKLRNTLISRRQLPFFVQNICEKR
jgi:hypothetical protein